MILRVPKYRRNESSWDLERIGESGRMKENDSFHTKDKHDYSFLVAALTKEKMDD